MKFSLQTLLIVVLLACWAADRTSLSQKLVDYESEPPYMTLHKQNIKLKKTNDLLRRQLRLTQDRTHESDALDKLLKDSPGITLD